MDIYEGLDVAKLMQPGDSAVCVTGTYRDYSITMNDWGDVCWSNGEVIGLDRYFINAKWKLLKKT